jgi:hypothetical protein
MPISKLGKLSKLIFITKAQDELLFIFMIFRQAGDE